MADSVPNLRLGVPYELKKIRAQDLPTWKIDRNILDGRTPTAKQTWRIRSHKRASEQQRPQSRAGGKAVVAYVVSSQKTRTGCK
jgi:hypothetical protein